MSRDRRLAVSRGLGENSNSISSHHRHGNCNFAVIDFFWDWLLGTYRRVEAGGCIVTSAAGMRRATDHSEARIQAMKPHHHCRRRQPSVSFAMDDWQFGSGLISSITV